MPWSSRVGDPGPCPVCSAPHTTCTSADYDGGITIPQMPMRDQMAEDLSAAVPCVPSSTTGPTFTTKTYRRKKP